MNNVTKEAIERLDAIIDQQNKELAEKTYFPVTYLCPLDNVQKTVLVLAKDAGETIPIHQKWLDAWVIKETENRRLQEIKQKEREAIRAKQDGIQAEINAEKEAIHLQFAKTSTYCNGCRYFDEESYSSHDDYGEYGEYRGCSKRQSPIDDNRILDTRDEGLPCERPDDCPTRIKE